MSHRHIIASLLSAIIFLADIVGSPVRDTYATYTQPDGSRFQVMVSGDEWIKIRKTMDGCAIVKDKDGWWCYGIYDDTGLIESSGYHVGNAPESVVSASRNIPYAILTKISRERRNIGQGSALETLESIRKSAAQTRSSENKVQKKGIRM